MLDGFQVFLLAAGRGRRQGGPKAWLLHEGRPLLERQLDFLLSLFPPANIAVSVQAEWSGRLRTPGVRWAPVDPDRTPLESLQTLIRGARQAPSFVYHVDMPVWEPRVFAALAAAKAEPAAVPVHQGRRGHPVLLSPRAQSELLLLEPASGRLDAWLRSRPCAEVAVPFPCIHENWNVPAQSV